MKTNIQKLRKDCLKEIKETKWISLDGTLLLNNILKETIDITIKKDREALLKDFEVKIERHRKRKHPAQKWCKKCKDFEEIKQLLEGGK